MVDRCNGSMMFCQQRGDFISEFCAASRAGGAESGDGEPGEDRYQERADRERHGRGNESVGGEWKKGGCCRCFNYKAGDACADSAMGRAVDVGRGLGGVP